MILAELGLAAVGFGGRYVTRAMLTLGVSPSASTNAKKVRDALTAGAVHP